MNSSIQRALIGTFVVLYLAVAFVSCWHAVTFFGISNETWIAWVLSVAFEVANAVVLFYLLLNKDRSRWMPWLMLTVCVAVQCIGNVTAVYKYIMEHDPQQVQYFIDSVMFFMRDPDPQANIVIVSYIAGALLPLIALGLTGMVVDMTSPQQEKTEEKEEKTEEILNDSPKIFL